MEVWDASSPHCPDHLSLAHLLIFPSAPPHGFFAGFFSRSAMPLTGTA
jgi:hypothetical protein